MEPKPSSSNRKLNSEFMYYNSILKRLAPALTDDNAKKIILQWIRKLFSPEYHSSHFREKRNKYLLSLTLNLFNDEAFGIFKNLPPTGALKDPNEISVDPIPKARWEIDTTWNDTVSGLPVDFPSLKCPVHHKLTECELDHDLDPILDQEFQLLLYMAKPFAESLIDVADKTKIAVWLQILCSISGDSYCSSIKTIRNDYMTILAGYLRERRVVGPFKEMPSWTILRPLPDIAKLTAESKLPLTHPCNPEANEFLSIQPVPDNGAFCYIAITGDLINGETS